MKLNRLTINNFYRYYGKQEIVFSTDNDKNITVLRGENGAGKTTLLNAFYWVMYGDVMEPLTIKGMLNNRAAEEMKNSSIETSYIKLEFEDRGTEYTILRKQKFIKQNNVIKPNSIEKPYIEYRDKRTGNSIEITEKDFFEGIIPKRLREFFFFDGERINKLAQVDGKVEIRKAILDILGLTTIDNTSKDLDGIRSEYIKEIAKNTNENERKLDSKLDSKKMELAITEEVLESHTKSLIEYNEELDKVTKYLEKSNSEIVKSKQRERSRIDKDLQISKNELESIKVKIASHISKNLKKPIIASYFSNIVEYLEDKREKGELPSDIKMQFVDDILERQRCICGCKLIPGTNQYITVENLKSVAGRSELDDAYSKITSYIKHIGDGKDFYVELEKLENLEGEVTDRIDELKESLKNISKELLNSNEEKIRYNESKRIELNKKINDIHNKIGKTENEIRSIKREIVKIEEDIRLCSVNNKIAHSINLKLEQVEKLIELNKEIKEYFVEATRIELDKKIKEVYSKITRKEYRVPVLTEQFELKITSTIKEDIVDEVEVLSTGEGQITSLSFIGSLVSYAREKTKEQFLSDFSGGDFPIVMDSPFGNLDQTHTSNVAANIGELASQVIIIVSDKQWNKDVEDNIKGKVGRMYKMFDENDNNKEIMETTVIKEVQYNG